MVKIQPRLFLTSFCALLASAVIVEAQTPQPRFGYGSVPRGAYVIPAPKTAPAPAASKPKPKPVASTSAKPKPKPVTTPAKPKTVASTKAPAKPATKSPPAKSSPSKAIAKTAPAKTSPVKSTAKEVVSAKTKTPAAKPVLKKEIARTGKTQTAPAKAAAAKPTPQIVKTAPVNATGNRKAVPAPVKSTGSQTPKTQLASTGPADPARIPISNGGFHFFGVPIVLPDPSQFPATTTTAQKTGNKEPFVDLMAARHAVNAGKSVFTPHRPEPKSVLARTDPAALTSAPEIAPAALAPQDFVIARTNPEPTIESAELFDDSTLARTAPVSLSLAGSVSRHDPIAESPLLDEPALPSPVVSSVEKPKPSKIKPLPVPEPALPDDQTAESTPLPDAIAAVAEEHDLSERERAFVLSLAEAAGSVTQASGKLNQDLPSSITTAATAALDQIPAETVSSFRSVAAAAKSSIRHPAKEIIPDLPMEISNDLMPSTPEKMPEQLPTFNAASSGKIDVQSDRQADYDQANNKVIFTGKVELNSAAIRLRAERVEVFMKKGGGGMERVEASGNVLMRTQDTASGPGQMASAGRASYNLKTGEITLSDWPKIQETGKSHISTDPSTKMYMFTDGRLRTDGPNRTLIGGE